MADLIRLSAPVLPEAAISQVAEVLRSGQLVHAAQCNAFEEELAAALGVTSVSVVSSGTAALHLSLLALGIGPGDAVIVPDFTFVATANAVEMTGARAVVVDVQADSYNLDPHALEEFIRGWNHAETLRAIIPVFEFGNAVNSERYREIARRYGLALIEDAACAFGAQDGASKAGSLGDLACFSFHPRKTLTTGEGGAVATSDPELARRVRLLRSHGMTRGGGGVQFESIGLNYRMTEFQAVIGRALLGLVPAWIERRRELAKRYGQVLSKLSQRGWVRLPVIGEGHACQSYMLTLEEQFEPRAVIEWMRAAGVELNVGAQSMTSLGLYPHAANSHSVVGTRLAAQGLVLPLHEHLSDDDVNRVAASLERCLAEMRK